MKNIVIGILAHVDAGKTTLSEAMLYQTGAIRNLGRELKIELVSHRNAMHPMYIQDFVHILQEELPRIADSMSLEELRKSIQ